MKYLFTHLKIWGSFRLFSIFIFKHQTLRNLLSIVNDLFKLIPSSIFSDLPSGILQGIPTLISHGITSGIYCSIPFGHPSGFLYGFLPGFFLEAFTDYFQDCIRDAPLILLGFSSATPSGISSGFLSGIPFKIPLEIRFPRISLKICPGLSSRFPLEIPSRDYFPSVP